MSFDIIGDIHGYASTLERLLLRLGYERIDSAFRHPHRRAIFLGDFIDGGPQQRATLEIVRPMVEAGHAMSVMGNHEFNALAYATPCDDGTHLRPRNADNTRQHAAFLAEFPVDTSDYRDVIDWFRTLPLWLDLGGLRVVHACWDREIMARIGSRHDGARLTATLLHQASTPGREEYADVETLLKGREIPLPDGHHYIDRYGKERRRIRIRWWDRGATTYREKFLGSPEWETHLPDTQITGDHALDYDRTEPPVFLGHYWLSGTPAPLADNVACLDYSVGRPGGKLAAYRWDGERRLRNEGFVWMARAEL